MSRSPEDVFHEARDISDPDARSVFLDIACAGDDTLRARVEALLAADAEAGSFLKTAPGSDANALDDAARTLLETGAEGLRDPARALGYATRACAFEEAAGGGKLWIYLDTLALAQHLTGDNAAAVATQQRALDLMPDGADPEMAERLAEYQAALAGDDAGARDDD